MCSGSGNDRFAKFGPFRSLPKREIEILTNSKIKFRPLSSRTFVESDDSGWTELLVCHRSVRETRLSLPNRSWTTSSLYCTPVSALRESVRIARSGEQFPPGNVQIGHFGHSAEYSPCLYKNVLLDTIILKFIPSGLVVIDCLPGTLKVPGKESLNLVQE